MKKKISKLLAVLLSVVILLANAIPIFAALTEGNRYCFTTKYLDAYYDTGSWQTADGHTHDNYGQVALRNLNSTGEPIYCIQIYNAVNNDAATAKNIKYSMKLSVMSHELSHAIMHSDEMATQLPQLQKEIEADSLSLMICQHLGITDVEDIRQDHLKSAYKKYVKMIEEDNMNTEYPDLSKILDNVNKAYNGIIDDFDKSINNYLEMHQETVQKLTLKEYLGLQGLASPYSDYMIDKVKIPRGLTQRQQNKHNKQALKANEKYHARRDAAIKEYNEKVASGEIIPPTNVERYIKAAKGHPDNKSTQAAIRVLTKRGYIQDNDGNWIKSTEVISQNEKDFKQTIDDFLNGNINPTDQIFVCQTTEVMRVCGADNLDVMIYQDTIRKILSDDLSKFEHPHNLTVDTLKQLPDQLQKPVMVFKGSHEGSIVLVTDLFNENSEQIIISCELDSGSQWNKINRITSMYGKENIANYLNTQITKGNLIGCHKKIANQMLHSVGLYLPSENTFIDYTDIISNFDKNVNRNNLTNEENIMDNTEKEKYNSYFTNNDEFDQEEFDKLSENKNVRYDFIQTTFRDIHFTDKDIIGRMSECRFWNCTFNHFDGIEIESNNSVFHNCTFESSDFSNAHFMSAQFYYCNFNNTNLKNSNIEFAKIGHTTFDKNTELSNVHFYGKNMNSNYIHNCIINEPVQGLSRDNITMGGATYQEIEIHRSKIFDALKIEPVSFEQIVEQSKASLEPLPEIGQDNTETNGKQAQLNYEIREITQWPEDKNHLSFSVVIDDYLFDGTFRIADDVNGKGMKIVGIDCYSDKQRNQVTSIWNKLENQLQESARQMQHLDMLRTIAEYEQSRNISPKERIVEMNYNTAHWQAKDTIDPLQIESVYNHITDDQHLSFNRVNDIRTNTGKSPYTPDDFYRNIKYNAFVEIWDFGNNNEINLAAINSALKEVPVEYVLDKMTL